MSETQAALSIFLALLPAVIIIALTVLLAWLVSWVVGGVMRRNNPQMAIAARRLAAVLVALIGGTLALQALGLNPDVLLVVIALLGGTVIFALREPLSNYGAKYFTDIYTPFKVGDSIQVHGVSGRVIQINPMTTVLLSETNQLVSVPNTSMMREVVVNTTPLAWKEVTIPVSVGNQVDLAAFESQLLKSLSKLRLRLDPRFPPVLATRGRTAQSTDLTVTLMLRRPEDREPITVEANKRLGDVLDGLGNSRR